MFITIIITIIIIIIITTSSGTRADARIPERISMTYKTITNSYNWGERRRKGTGRGRGRGGQTYNHKHTIANIYTNNKGYLSKQKYDKQ